PTDYHRHFPAQSCRVDEHEPANDVGAALGESQRDESAERGTDEVEATHAEPRDPGVDELGDLAPQLRPRLDAGGETESREVRREDAEALRQAAHDSEPVGRPAACAVEEHDGRSAPQLQIMQCDAI